MRRLITLLAFLSLTLVMAACIFRPALSASPTIALSPASLPTPYVMVLVTDMASPTLTIVTTSAPILLPDLIIKSIYLEMEGRHTNCVDVYSPYGIRVLVENIGLASARPFIVDMNGMRQQVDTGLTAGQHIELHFAGTTPSGQYEAFADVTNQVVESDEYNNTLSFIAPTPTPPLLCTPTLTQAP
jgi:subtilase family serine protease